MVEEAHILTERIERQKDLQESQISLTKEQNLINPIAKILCDIELNVYLYYLNVLYLSPHSRDIDLPGYKLNEFLLSIKKAIVQHCIELQGIKKKVIVPFLSKVLSGLSPEKANETYKNLALLFPVGFGLDLDRLSTSKLRAYITKLEQTTDDSFKLDLKALGLSKKYQECSDLKASLIEAYRDFLVLTEQRIVELRKLLSTFSMTYLDKYLIIFEKCIREDDQRLQERYVNESIRMHALYTQYHQELDLLISNWVQPKYIQEGEETKIINGRKFVGPHCERTTQAIDLLQVVRESDKEGLFPDHIEWAVYLTGAQIGLYSPTLGETSQQKDKQRWEVWSAPQEMHKFKPTAEQSISFQNTIEFFSRIGRIRNMFSSCSIARHYENASEKVYAVEKVECILANAVNVNDYNDAFYLIAPYINRHKHDGWDSFFGNKVTRTWNKVMKQIREPATNALLKEVGELKTADAKIQRLKEACEMPLFNQHRNNHWYTGAFGDTHAVVLIKKEIANLEEQKKQSRLSL